MAKQIGHDVTINGKEYFICSWGADPHKVVNSNVGIGISLEIQVTDKATGQLMEWKNIKKDVYLMEKVSDFAHNSFNGQNSFYWDWKKHEEGGK